MSFIRRLIGRVMSTPAPNQRSNRMIWFDGEMTGLELEFQRFVEVACIVTEADLTPVATYGPVVINQPEEVMQNMSKWCKKTFKKNGLLDKIAESKITEEQVDTEFLAFLEEHTDHFTSPLAGNSVNIDRGFIEKCLPNVAKHLHYRTIDVTSIKELAKRWYPDIFERMPEKKLNHRSLDDILESIDELKYYRENLFIK